MRRDRTSKWCSRLSRQAHCKGQHFNSNNNFMAKYSVTGAAGNASATAATAGLVMVDNPSSAPLNRAKIYDFSVGSGATPEDSQYVVSLKRQTTRGTWTSVTPAPIDSQSSASLSTAGRASTAAGSASTVLGYWGFNMRGGMRYTCVPGGEFCNDGTVSHGIILEYAVVSAGTAVNYATLLFEE